MRIEIRPGEGGTDAEQFAKELAGAIAKHANVTLEANGTTMVLDRL